MKWWIKGATILGFVLGLGTAILMTDIDRSMVMLVLGGVTALIGFYGVLMPFFHEGDGVVPASVTAGGMIQVQCGLGMVFAVVVPPGTWLYSIIAVFAVTLLVNIWVFRKVRRAEQREIDVLQARSVEQG